MSGDFGDEPAKNEEEKYLIVQCTDKQYFKLTLSEEENSLDPMFEAVEVCSEIQAA